MRVLERNSTSANLIQHTACLLVPIKTHKYVKFVENLLEADFVFCTNDDTVQSTFIEPTWASVILDMPTFSDQNAGICGQSRWIYIFLKHACDNFVQCKKNSQPIKVWHISVNCGLMASLGCTIQTDSHNVSFPPRFNDLYFTKYREDFISSTAIMISHLSLNLAVANTVSFYKSSANWKIHIFFHIDRKLLVFQPSDAENWQQTVQKKTKLLLTDNAYYLSTLLPRPQPPAPLPPNPTSHILLPSTIQ